MLKCETNSPEIEKEICEQFQEEMGQHKRVQADFEHGQWFVTCVDCGAQWSVNDSSDGFDFEEITEGDEDFPCQ